MTWSLDACCLDRKILWLVYKSKGEQQQIQKIALHLSSSRRMESNEWTYLLGRIGTAALNKLDPPLEIVLLLFSLVELL